MFATCLHCHAALGTNDTIEHFPIGQRLAFDAAKGRLWVVCDQCKRWNLTPLEERWEAIEECERLFRATPLRVSSGNIGLARLKSGMEVVRIGAPEMPEMAAWRYGRDFKRRWLRRGVPSALLYGGGMTAVQQAMIMAGDASKTRLMAQVAASAIAGALLFVLTRTKAARVVLPTGKVQRVSRRSHILLRPTDGTTGWGVQLLGKVETPLLDGMPAIQTLRAVTTARNFAGASQQTLDTAIDRLAETQGSEQFIRRLAVASTRTEITVYPPDISLALEMALHEDTERRAMEGELSLLRDEWQLAEEIAGISDNMFLPARVRLGDSHAAEAGET